MPDLANSRVWIVIVDCTVEECLYDGVHESNAAVRNQACIYAFSLANAAELDSSQFSGGTCITNHDAFPLIGNAQV